MHYNPYKNAAVRHGWYRVTDTLVARPATDTETPDSHDAEVGPILTAPNFFKACERDGIKLNYSRATTLRPDETVGKTVKAAYRLKNLPGAFYAITFTDGANMRVRIEPKEELDVLVDDKATVDAAPLVKVPYMKDPATTPKNSHGHDMWQSVARCVKCLRKGEMPPAAEVEAMYEAAIELGAFPDFFTVR